MELRVDCVTSEAGSLEPNVVWFGSRAVPVLAVVDRWWAPDRRWWKVDTAEGQYVLRRDEPTGSWELAAVVGREPDPSPP